MADTKADTLPQPKTLADLARPHFTDKDFDPTQPEAVLTLYMEGLRLALAYGTEYKFIDLKACSGDHYNAPAGFHVVQMDAVRPYLSIEPTDKPQLCSAHWEIYNIDSAAEDDGRILDITEYLISRVSSQGTKGAKIIPQEQDIKRTPEQLGAMFYLAAVNLLPQFARDKLDAYLRANDITAPTLDLAH